MKTNKKKNKDYLKAVEYYDKGELDKAIKLCDECISQNLKNGSALNLKGLILYIKGDLEGARAQWKINSDYNDDTIAKNYLFDSLKDAERLKLYREAKYDIKEIRINEAMKKLSVCKESDFNSIKVNLALAVCCFRKADYSGCSVYLANVLSMDKRNETAIKLAKDLKTYDGVKLNVSSDKGYLKYIAIGAMLLILVTAGGFTVKKLLTKNNGKIDNIEASELIEDKEDKPQEEIVENVNDSEDKGETKVEETINFTELSKLINEKKYDDVYDKLQKVNPNSLAGQEKSIYYNGKQLLTKDGVEYFYKKGYDLYTKKLFAEASEEFTKGCTYGKENYLYQHLVFFNAACYEAIEDSDKAIKYYEEYYKNFKESDYIAECIYKLAILYKNKDIDKSIKYAEELKYDYSSSMYNNDVISNLIASVK
mgnify:FL=1